MKMKNSALSGAKGGAADGSKGSSKVAHGYQLLHVLLVAIILLIIGALIK